MNYAQYRDVKSLDHRQGKSHPKTALRAIFLICYERFGTANSVRENHDPTSLSAPLIFCLCHPYHHLEQFCHDFFWTCL